MLTTLVILTLAAALALAWLQSRGSSARMEPVRIRIDEPAPRRRR